MPSALHRNTALPPSSTVRSTGRSVNVGPTETKQLHRLQAPGLRKMLFFSGSKRLCTNVGENLLAVTFFTQMKIHSFYQISKYQQQDSTVQAEEP